MSYSFSVKLDVQVMLTKRIKHQFILALKKIYTASTVTENSIQIPLQYFFNEFLRASESPSVKWELLCVLFQPVVKIN